MKLKAYISANSLRIADFAKQIGVSTATAYRMANGSTIPEPETMRRIHEFTNGEVCPDDFILLSNTAAE
jgi:transcriptional regulator with XRE-family HTH domain